MRVFVDTNVYIDLIGNRAGFVEDARRLCIAASFDDIELWVSAQTIADADYLFRKPGQREEARRKMASSLELFHVCGTHALDAQEALASHWPDVEDYLIAASARNIRATALITRDAAGFAASAVPVFSPKDYLTHLEEEMGLFYSDIPFLKT